MPEWVLGDFKYSWKQVQERTTDCLDLKAFAEYWAKTLQFVRIFGIEWLQSRVFGELGESKVERMSSWANTELSECRVEWMQSWVNAELSECNDEQMQSWVSAELSECRIEWMQSWVKFSECIVEWMQPWANAELSKCRVDWVANRQTNPSTHCDTIAYPSNLKTLSTVIFEIRMINDVAYFVASNVNLN